MSIYDKPLVNGQPIVEPLTPDQIGGIALATTDQMMRSVTPMMQAMVERIVSLELQVERQAKGHDFTEFCDQLGDLAAGTFTPQGVTMEQEGKEE